jgi:hypothetical protein
MVSEKRDRYLAVDRDGSLGEDPVRCTRAGEVLHRDGEHGSPW